LALANALLSYLVPQFPGKDLVFLPLLVIGYHFRFDEAPDVFAKQLQFFTHVFEPPVG
jgi:hypothetical protein